MRPSWMEEDTVDSADTSESVFFSKVSHLLLAQERLASKTPVFSLTPFSQLSCPLVFIQLSLFSVCPECFMTLSQNTPSYTNVLVGEKTNHGTGPSGLNTSGQLLPSAAMSVLLL